MRITHVSIRNYKSLRSVEMAPTDLSVIVGANASGKSNLADCFEMSQRSSSCLAAFASLLDNDA